MSEEEKKAIEYLKENLLVRFENEKIVAVGNSYKLIILNLIEKQQKEIETQQKEIKELKDNYIRLQNTEAIQDIYIKKDKIRAKIEEYEDYGTSICYGLRSNGRAFHQAVRMEVKEVLQALLEEDK